MLWTLIVILVIMWALGMGVGTIGNIIHLLLVIALVLFVLQLVQGRRAV
jgi:uncharacterized membrane protein YtjA (UPF0391 family)